MTRQLVGQQAICISAHRVELDSAARVCRRFLLEWLSFLHRYIPVGLLETGCTAAHLNWRNPGFRGRSRLEGLLGSDDPRDWVAISEMLLGPPPPDFVFAPKHKAQVDFRFQMGSQLCAPENV